MITIDPSSEKRRGGYYTPRPLADFLVRWAVRSPFDHVLDPACGEAVFLDVAAQRLRELGDGALDGQIVGYELDPIALAEARRAVPEASIAEGSFFDQEPSDSSFQAVVGNPPYIRYHYFSGRMRAAALSRARAEGVHLSQLTSSWAPFLVHAITFLAPDGRLAFVLPAELLTTDYASSIREYLRQRFASVDVLTFEERVFPGVLVDAVLLLAEGTGPGQVRVHRLPNASALNGFDGETTPPTKAAKWTHAFVGSEAADVFETAAAGMRRFGSVASVDIGLVTGANSFFLLTDDQAKKEHLQHRDLRRALARGQQLRSYALSDQEWNDYRRRGEIVWIFAPTADTGAAGAYIRKGEAAGVHESYKCSIRTPWWKLKIWDPPDLILSYMSNHFPRLLSNDAHVQTTNLLHNVRLLDDSIDAHTLALSWLNSATMLSCELAGRAYGGGVLKLETREAEKVFIPRLNPRVTKGLSEQAAAIDALLRGARMTDVADLVDPIVLAELSANGRTVLREAWLDLRERRRSRAAPASK